MKQITYTKTFVSLLLSVGFYSVRQISLEMNLKKSFVSRSINLLLQEKKVVVFGFRPDETGKLIELTYTSDPFFLEVYNYRNN